MTELKAKVWLEKDGLPVLGEGRARLLEAIDEEHSIIKAAEKLGMSYRHAWGLVQKMKESLGEGVVISMRGGNEGGSTELNERGRRLLKEYYDKVHKLESALKEARL
ncbi:MAG: LysR family transcriptional regulator [Methanocellales archaeon]|nr:LysR family transcriptional regulator [Methanocellales archaeon]MDD3291678.1 LysR family transcriptional regulator [Methanocellales archaeon]MDD5235028.1 LysR family transcriptional regulator [Methanocellales archaeon]MDD5485166.1 LysR family transcriptional regulator [Methanocellales archaeon]